MRVPWQVTLSQIARDMCIDRNFHPLASKTARKISAQYAPRPVVKVLKRMTISPRQVIFLA